MRWEEDFSDQEVHRAMDFEWIHYLEGRIVLIDSGRERAAVALRN